ncbi:MAG: class I SAM-dependent methyltransferase [Myxococcota bacterium]
MNLILTTARSHRQLLEPDAEALAQHLGLPFVRRSHGLKRLIHAHGAWGAYVVSRDRHMVETVWGEQLVVGPGMFYLKRIDGHSHPLIRAVAPADGAPVRRIWDGTLGLAGDALHLAHVLDATVVGSEANPILESLVREGLGRMGQEGKAWSAAARRVAVVGGLAQQWWASQPDDSVPVVTLDLMFPEVRRATTGFEVARRLAHGDPLQEELLGQACRVASRRVVVKWPGGVDAPEVVPPPLGRWNRRLRGKAVDYLVAEFELEHPTVEMPDHGTPP